MYDFVIRLTSAQIAAYEREGIPYISRLAEEVRYDQTPFNAQKA